MFRSRYHLSWLSMEEEAKHGAGTKTHRLDQLHEKCQSSLQNRLRWTSHCSRINIYLHGTTCVYTHLWWRTNFKSHEEITVEHRDYYYKTSIVLLRVHEAFRSNMHNRSREYSCICQQFLRIYYVCTLHETFWSFISAAMTPNYQDHIGKIFNDSETIYQKCVICIISTVKALCGKCTNTFTSHCTFSNATPAAGFLRIIFNKLSLFPARYDTKRLSRATVSYNTFITRAGQTRASIDDWLVP